MLMGPLKMSLFRLYNITLGHFALTDTLLRKALVKLLVKNKAAQKGYCQCSSYFSYDQLQEGE